MHDLGVVAAQRHEPVRCEQGAVEIVPTGPTAFAAMEAHHAATRRPDGQYMFSPVDAAVCRMFGGMRDQFHLQAMSANHPDPR